MVGLNSQIESKLKQVLITNLEITDPFTNKMMNDTCIKLML